MTLGNRLESELNQIIETGAATGNEEGRALSWRVFPAGTTAYLRGLSFAGTSEVPAMGSSRSKPCGVTGGRTTRSMANLTAEVEQLRDRVEALERELAQIKDSFPGEEIIVLRSISRDQAKQEILELFQSGEVLFYSDVARRLQLDLPLVVELCQELQHEGEIEVDADAV
jgi:hypothetical protein